MQTIFPLLRGPKGPLSNGNLHLHRGLLGPYLLANNISSGPDLLSIEREIIFTKGPTGPLV